MLLQNGFNNLKKKLIGIRKINTGFYHDVLLTASCTLKTVNALLWLPRPVHRYLMSNLFSVPWPVPPIESKDSIYAYLF
jgi:hypothetical protein